MNENLKLDPSANIRPSPIAGLWYSGNPVQLAAQIDDYLAQASLPHLTGEVVALISPHAGHIYSGRTAGHAFRSVQGSQKDLVVVVSPCHAYHPSPLLTTGHRAYSTPLGNIPIDLEALQQLEKELGEQNLRIARISNDDEHSIEIQLPFLQRSLKGEFTLLPVMARDNTLQTCKVLGKALAHCARGRSSLLVASTDLSHHYPETIARALDSEMLHQFESFEPEGVLAAERSGSGFACGAAAVAAVLFAARDLGADTVQILHYSTSADETGDSRSVVGYGAAAVIKTI
jgi:MEMO1 family protein